MANPLHAVAIAVGKAALQICKQLGTKFTYGTSEFYCLPYGSEETRTRIIGRTTDLDTLQMLVPRQPGWDVSTIETGSTLEWDDKTWQIEAIDCDGGYDDVAASWTLTLRRHRLND